MTDFDARAIGQSCLRPDGSMDLARARGHIGPVPRKGRVFGGEVLINSTGTGTLGRVALLPELDDSPTFVDGHVTLIRVDLDRCDARFLAYALGPPAFIALAEQALSVGSTKQRELNVDAVRRHAVRAPAVDTQRRVADYLDRECERIAALNSSMQRNSSQLDALRGACVREVTATLRHAPLKYCGSVIDCKHRTAEYLDSGLPLVSTREISRGSLRVDSDTRRVGPADFADLRDGGRDPRRGDIIYSRNASVGIAAYLADDLNVCMGQDVVLITRRPRDCELLNYVLNWGVLDQVERLSVGSTFSRINVATIRELLVPDDSPSREAEALAAIHREFLRLESFEQTAHAFGARLNEHRNALITEAVTGQLDIATISDSQMDERVHAAAEGAVATSQTQAQVR